MTGHSYVLLLDDDPWAVEVTRVMLETNGVVIQAAQTLEEALDAVRRNGPPSVLLLDVVMPGMNGFEVCRHLRSEPSLRHTRIVFLTSLTDESARLKALDAGADDIISKPVSEAILVARIRSLAELARLRDRSQQYLEHEAVLDSINEGVITLDGQDRVLTANAPARRLLGLPDNGWSGLHLPSFVTSAWTVERGSIEPPSKARLVWHANGSRVAAALDWTARTLPGSDETHAAWTVVVRDATDALEQDRAVGRLIRTLGHKLRTPLTGVATSLDLLSETVPPDGDSQLLVQIGRESSERLRKTLVRILEYTNAVAPTKTSREFAVLEPSNVVEQLGLDDDVDLDVRCADPVTVDIDLARRCIAELVTNARQAGAANVALEVEHGLAGMMRFSVTDDGRGLPPSTAERIFEPFYQSDRSGEASGSGLGLAIVAAEVEARQGSFGARSPHGESTTVWFALPTGKVPVSSSRWASESTERSDSCQLGAAAGPIPADMTG